MQDKNTDTTQAKASASQLSVENGVAFITLCRPEKHNAFDDQVIQSLLQNLETVKADDTIRVMVLQSQGKSFSAGGDLAWMKRMAELNYDENIADAKQLALLMQRLNELPIPSIAKVQGAAFGGAIGLIACCDIAIASEKAKFCLSEVKLGLAPATISPYVVAAMGARRCRQLFVTAELFSAQQAADWGLVHSLCAHDELDTTVNTSITNILANGPQACRASKQLIAEIANGREDLFDETARVIASLRVSEEGQEGLSAFFEKRKPSWQSKA